MTLIEFTNFILRIVTIIPVFVIIFILIRSIIEKRNLNGLTPTRWALLLLAVGLGAEIFVRLVGDIHIVAGFGNGVQSFLKNAQWVLVAARGLMFVGVAAFADLFLKEKHG